MENKKLGGVLIILSLIIGIIFIKYAGLLEKQSQELGCFPKEECIRIENTLSFSHVAIGTLSFLLALGFYLIFFNKTEKVILERLEEEKKIRSNEEKLEILMNALDEYEKKAVKLISEQPGITQSTLRIKADMSKAKLSYVLQGLEKKGIVKRIEKGKTLEIYLKI